MNKCAFLLLLCSSSCWASFSGYTYRREISIEQENVSTQSLTLTNFPVLISTTDVTLSTSASGGHMQTAYDLVFSTMPDCSFLLDWDTETVNNTGTSTMTVWVNLPSISSNTDTPFFMCYGNSGITTYQGISTMTWNSNFVGVWHMSDPGPTQHDSTQYGDTLNSSGTVQFGQTGLIGNAIHIAALSSGLHLTSLNANLSAVAQSSMTVYAIYQSTTAGAQTGLVTIAGGPGGDFTYVNALAENPSPQRISNGSTIVVSSAALVQNQWSNIGVMRDGTNTNFIYNGSVSSMTAQAMGTSSGVIQIGIGCNYACNANTAISYWDEVQIYNGRQTPGWIQTEFNNQSSPSTFAEIGPETITPNVSGTALLQVQGGKLLINDGTLLVQ